MLQISKEQLYKRLDIMPQGLKDILFSSQASDQLFDICRKEHLSEEKAEVVAQLAGDVVMGFIHREDLPKEIQKELGIDIKIGQSIYDQINRKIFFSAASEIDKFYAPPPKEEIKEEKAYVIPTDAIPADADDVIDLKNKAETEETGVKGDMGFDAPAPLVAPVQTVSSTPASPIEEAPHILHKADDVQAVRSQKKSFGGFLNIFKKDYGAGLAEPIKDRGVEARIITPNESSRPNPKSAPLTQADPKEIPPVKFINYSASAPVQNAAPFSDVVGLAPFTPPKSDVGGAKLSENEAEIPTPQSAPLPKSEEIPIAPKIVNFSALRPPVASSAGGPHPSETLREGGPRPTESLDAGGPTLFTSPKSDVGGLASPKSDVGGPASPQPTSPDKIDLKDIPVEDVIDLRKI